MTLLHTLRVNQSEPDSIVDVTQMLSRVSYESLKKAAIYGAVLSVSGCSVLYYLIQRKGSPYNPCSHSHAWVPQGHTCNCCSKCDSVQYYICTLLYLMDQAHNESQKLYTCTASWSLPHCKHDRSAAGLWVRVRGRLGQVMDSTLGLPSTVNPTLILSGIPICSKYLYVC